MQRHFIPIYLFISFLCYSYITGVIPALVFTLYIFMGLVVYLVYLKDKLAAKNGRWRTKETTLHLLSFLFGWPGAIIAQQTLRHKTQKVSFRLVFWLTATANTACIAWLYTEQGENFLQSGLYKLGLFITGFNGLNHSMPWLLELTKLRAWL